MYKSCLLVVNSWNKFMVSVRTPIQGQCFPYHWSKRSKGVSQLEYISCTAPDNLFLLVALVSAFLQPFTYLTLMSAGQKPHWSLHEPGLSSACKKANVLFHHDHSGLLKLELGFYNPMDNFFSLSNLDEQHPFKYCWIPSGTANCQKCLTFGGPHIFQWSSFRLILLGKYFFFYGNPHMDSHSTSLNESTVLCIHFMIFCEIKFKMGPNEQRKRRLSSWGLYWVQYAHRKSPAELDQRLIYANLLFSTVVNWLIRYLWKVHNNLMNGAHCWMY